MRWVLKTSSVHVATRDRESVYRSIEDVPTALLDEMQEVFAGPNTKTIYIKTQEANERNDEQPASKPWASWRMALAAGFLCVSVLALLWLWLILGGKS